MSSPGPSLSQLTNPVCQVIPSSEQLNIAHNMKAILSVGLLFSLIAVSSSAFIGDILLGRIDETLVKVIALEEDIDILEENEKKGKEKIENLEKGQDQANEKLVALEKDIDILEKNGKKEKEKIENLERGQDQANVKVVALEEEIDILEENEKKGGEKIETLENELAQSNLKVGVIQDKIGALGEEIGIIEEKEMKGKERIENLENELAQSNLKVTNLEDTVGKLENELSDTNNKFDKMEKLLQELISRVDDPCVDDPCGPNSECKNAGGVATCSCLAGYEGSPPSCKCGTESCEAEVIFLGPGLGSKGQSEVLNMTTMASANCTPPPHPTEVDGYVATATPDGPMLCGGWPYTSDCHLLTKSGTWNRTAPMMTKRYRAVSITFGGGWWVTGGHDGKNFLATTEMFNHTWQSNTNLPQALFNHCLTKLNTTHALLTGGLTTGDDYSAASYLYSVGTGFVKTRNMKTGRNGHTCSLHADGLVLVAGGRTADGDSNTVEFFSLDTLQWNTGPNLPIATGGGEMMSVNGKTIFLGGRGNKKIFQLSTSDDLTTAAWTEVGEMTVGRSFFSAIKINFDECKTWN